MKTRILWLPGLLSDARLFGPQLAALSAIADHTVADLTVADNIAGLARAAIAALPAGPFAVAGMSMGGYVALEVMRQAPGRVTHLALMNTNARADSPESIANRRRLMALAGQDFDAVIAGLLAKQFHPAHLADKALVRLVTDMALAVGVEAFRRQQEAIIGRIDSRPRLAAIACPTLVLAAREDAIMPLELLEELAGGIPGARLRVVGPSGHLAPLEQPEAVSAELHALLAP